MRIEGGGAERRWEGGRKGGMKEEVKGEKVLCLCISSGGGWGKGRGNEKGREGKGGKACFMKGVGKEGENKGGEEGRIVIRTREGALVYALLLERGGEGKKKK